MAHQAHQAHALPWQTIADHFKFVYSNKKYHGRTSLYPCFKPGQGKQLQHFARVFARLMDEHSAQERKKYLDEPTPPEDDEIYIPDSSVKRIAKTVKWYKHSNYGKTGYTNNDGGLADEERKLPYYFDCIRDCYSSYPKKGTHECVELLKTLLLYGEMEPLFRLASHPQVDLSQLWWFVWDNSNRVGWADVANCALMAYLCLNIFIVKPELHHPASRAQRLKEMTDKYGLSYTEQMYDYRNTSCYQKMLVQLTWTRWDHCCEVTSLPHREFFGIEKDMITIPSRGNLASDRMGYGPVSKLFDARFRNRYVPNAPDRSAVIGILKTRVPTEIALLILDFADYTAKRRVPVPNDPLHADNADELKKYISYCWKVLVRVDMLFKANGRWIDWEYEVTDALFDLYGVPYPKMSKIIHEDDYEGRIAGEVDRGRIRRVFT